MLKNKIPFFKAIGLIGALLIFISCAFFLRDHATELLNGIKELGWIAPVLFIILYAVATILFLPTMVLTFAGGALFGPFAGTLINLLGAICGALSSFLISRHLVHAWFSKKRGKRLNQLIAGVNQKGWLFVALLRVFPILPFNLVNYGLGLTDISLRMYSITTIVFLIPAEILYTYFGHAGKQMLLNPGHWNQHGELFYLGGAVLFFLLLWYIKQTRQKTLLASNNP